MKITLKTPLKKLNKYSGNIKYTYINKINKLLKETQIEGGDNLKYILIFVYLRIED